MDPRLSRPRVKAKGGRNAMGMSPTEIVASLKELCVSVGPRLSTSDIVMWIDDHCGFESPYELIAFAKRMKARQFARQLTFEDEETGLKVKRLWSLRDGEGGQRSYYDILDMPPERRRRLIDQYSKLLEQQRSIRRAMSDFLAGQQFFPFYTDEDELEPSLERLSG
jgi:hypothetical protein